MKEIIDSHLMEQYLKQFELEQVFQGKVRDHLALYQFDPGEALCLQGEKPEFLFFLVKGKLKVYTASVEGKTLLINFTNPLEVIGEIECLRDRENLNSVIAVTSAQAIGIRKSKLHQYEGEAAFLKLLLYIVTGKFYRKSISLGSNLLYPVEVRLASYLLSVCPKNEKEALERKYVSNLKDIANLIGTSYRHVNRILHRFCSKGLVERRRGFILVKDREGLYTVAGHNIYEQDERKGQQW